MWLHVPFSAWDSAPASEGSSSELSSPSPDTELCVSSSGTVSPQPLSWRGWKRRPWVKRLFGTISDPLRAARGVAAWISSLPGSPASPSPSPESSEGPRTIGGSGRTSSASLGRFNPDGSFSKTSLDLFDTDSSPSSVDLPNWGTMRCGVVSAQKELDAPIGAIGSSSSPGGAWTTPTVWLQEESPESFEARRQRNIEKGYNGNGMGTPLGQQVRGWPTPTHTDAESSARHTTATGVMKPGTTLTDATRGWPSPSARDWKDTSPLEARGQGKGAFAERMDQLPRVAQGWPTPRAADGENGSEYVTRGDGSNPSLLGASRSFLRAPMNGRRGNGSSQPARSLPRLFRLLRVWWRAGDPKWMRLNPGFVEWLMGWPQGWSRPFADSFGSETTAFVPAGMASFRYRLRMRSWLSLIAPDGWTSLCGEVADDG